MNDFADVTFVLLILIYVYATYSSKSMASEIMLLFFGVYYVLPPLVYYFFIPHNDYLNMSNEVIFKKVDLISMAPVLSNVMAIFFVFLFTCITNLKPDINRTELVNVINKNKVKLLFFLYFGSLIVLLMNLYLVYNAGGFYKFYFESKFHERYSGGLVLSLIMNFKSILPCFLLAISASLFLDRKTRFQTILISIFLLALFAFGGSNRKFMLFGFFVYFIVIVDVFGFKKIKSKFYFFILMLFILFQGLLFLRSASFDINALTSAFSSAKEVILTSEPIGTYSNVLTILNKFINNEINYSYFFDVLKIPFFGLFTLLDINEPNIAHSLGYILLGIEGFTFFPTIIVEGIYNGGVLGCMILLLAFSFFCRFCQKIIFQTNDYFLMIFSAVVFNICLVQLIRGYLSVCIAYFILSLLLYYVLKLSMKLKVN